MSDIVFLDHESRKDDDARRQVRSAAAQHSHRFGPRKPKARKAKTRGGGSSDKARPAVSRRGSAISVATSATSSSIQVASEDEDCQAGTETSLTRPASKRRQPLSRLGSYADEPFDSYPVPSQPWFAETLDYLWHFALRGWTCLKTTSEEQSEALLWFKRTTMNEPAYFYMNLLSAVGDLVSRGQRDPSLQVWLTGQVVASINQALDDQTRSLSVGTILTVGRLALREIVVGDKNAGITYHRPAFARMIVLAGGVKALKLPSLVCAHLGWADRIMTQKTGVRIVQIEPALTNEDTFSALNAQQGHNDVEVLKTYRPYRTKRPGSPEDEARDPETAGEEASSRKA